MTVSPLLQAKDDARTYTETNYFKIWNLTMLWLQSLVTAKTDNISVLLKKCPTSPPPIYVAGQQVKISHDDRRQDRRDCSFQPTGLHLV